MLWISLALVATASTTATAEPTQVAPSLDCTPLSWHDSMPSGGTISDVADTWIMESIPLDSQYGGMTRFEDTVVSARGRSWKLLRHRYGGFDISHPFRAGQPLFDLQWTEWRKVCLNDWGDREFNLSASLPEASRGADLRLRGGAYAWEGTYLPRNTFDQEPAVDFGANPFRRKIRSDLDLQGSVTHELGGGLLTLGALMQTQSNNFPTLRGAGLEAIDTQNRRNAGLARWQGPRGWKGIARVEAEDRSHQGAAYRWSGPSPREQQGGVRLVGIGQDKDELSWTAVIFDRRDRYRRLGENTDFEKSTEWWTMRRLRYNETIQSQGLNANLRLEPKPGWWGTGDLRVSSYRFTHEVPGGQILERFEGIGNRVSELQAADATGYHLQIPLVAGHDVEVGDFDLGAEGGVQWTHVGTHRSDDFIAPSWKLHATWTPKEGRVGSFRMLGGESPEFSLEDYVRYRHEDGLRGEIYAWDDANGDGVFDPGERGALERRTGGDVRFQESTLKHPKMRHFLIEWAKAWSKWGTRVQMGLNDGLNRWTVRERGGESFTAGGNIPDTSGIAGGDRDIETFSRTGPTESYVLVNKEERDRFMGLALELASHEGMKWWWSVNATGYWNYATTPMGVFADRNDPWALDEVTADPNKRINDDGRSDAGRAYHFIIAAMRKLPKGQSLGGTLRYRDGQPMSRMIELSDPSQPTDYIMAYERGDPVPRFTFHATFDLAYRLKRELGEHQDIEFGIDMLNALGSGTEINEELRSGPNWRDPFEVVPGRTVFAHVAIKTRPKEVLPPVEVLEPASVEANEAEQPVEEAASETRVAPAPESVPEEPALAPQASPEAESEPSEADAAGSDVPPEDEPTASDEGADDAPSVE